MENNNTRRPARVGRTILIAVLAVVILVLLLSSLYVVQPNEYGVVRQFGAVVDVKSEPGPVSYTHLTLPTICSV